MTCRTLAMILVLVLLGPGCDSRTAITPDGGVDGPKVKTDGNLVYPDADPLRRDIGGGSFVYQGKVLLGELVDPLVNMPGWIDLRVGFATAFYEPMFGPTSTHGECKLGEMLPPPPAVTVFVNAGEVRVTGVQAITFTYNPNDYYLDDIKDGVYSLFNGGEVLSVGGSGSAQIPPFDTTIKAPAKLSIQTPPVYNDITKVDPGQDYAVTWTKAGADMVRAVLHCEQPVGTWKRAECESSDDGQLLLRSDVLKAMAQACPSGVMIDIERVNEHHVDQGPARVTVRASTLIRGRLSFK